jgi:hypothetical protein
LGTLSTCQPCAWQARLESVDSWPMAIIIHKIFGGRPKLVSASCVTGRRYPPPERCMLYFVKRSLVPEQVYNGPSFRELSGGKWINLVGISCSFCSYDPWIGRVQLKYSSLLW